VVDLRRNSSQRKPPPNYFSRREQRRLLLMVMTLGLVVFLMFQAAKPSTWAWLWAGARGGATQNATQREETPAYYDTRVRPTSPQRLPLDTFLSPAEKTAKGDAEGEFFPGVEPSLLAEVRDHTVFRAAESEAWFHLLGVLQEADEAALEKESLGPVGFIQLYEQPDTYRGKLITLHGAARRAFDLQAPPNDYGIEKYYQIWLNPDGGPNSPVVIYALDLPDDFPSSRVPGSNKPRNIYEPIEVTGFFYKNWAYGTGTQILSAPLLAAKTIDWKPPVLAERQPTRATTSSLFTILGVGAALGLVAAGLVYWSSRHKPAASVGALAARFQADSLRKLEDEDLGPSVRESLRALAEEEGEIGN
jgi:hypothetical protein